MNSAEPNPNHPLVGTWVQVENPFNTTTVVYTIKVRNRRFSVTGVDESDGSRLTTSNTSWDGKKLRFVSVFPPTKHKAVHEFWTSCRNRARHKVSYSDEDGDFIENELWARRPVCWVKT